MTIEHKLAEQGAFLFRWRSYVPMVLILPALLAISESALVEERYGDFVEEIWVLFGFLISMAGLAVRWFTVGFVPAGTSGRNTKDQRAEHLNTDGLYSIVKNPLYIGNFLAILGVLISIKVWWLTLLGCLAYWMYIERVIAAEEKFLSDRFGATYAEWAEKTPTFIPNIRLWRAPDMKFSTRTVLKREYNGFFAVCAAFFISEMVVDVIVDREPFLFWLLEDWPWTTAFLVGLSVFVVLRTLKKHTRLLRIEGR